MATKFPIHPAHPERVCWGCDRFCASDAMACANERSPHPVELFGDDWQQWGEQQLADRAPPDALNPADHRAEMCQTNTRSATPNPP